jgi:FkbM family methyltransferase
VISYAQNAEDVVLARLFGDRDTGRYVDVGAGDPVIDSVTKYFYDRGWQGINVEPIGPLADALARARPRDVNLAVALGAEPGSGTLHLVEDRPGWSTLDDALASAYRTRDELSVRDVPVTVRTLADVLDEHPGPVDFLKIDVEGGERAVIAGADWTRHRPRVLVVEATEPGRATQAHQDWEPLLVAAGYRCALFDGLNRFYARSEDTEALATLAAPANVLDEFERADVAGQRAALEDARVQRAAEVGYVRRVESAQRDAEQARATEVATVLTLRQQMDQARRRSARTDRYVAALENRITELETGRPATRPLPPAQPPPTDGSEMTTGTTTGMTDVPITRFDTDFDAAARRAEVAKVDFWWHSIDVGDGVCTPGAKTRDVSDTEWRRMAVGDLTGRSVLDIGAWDGAYSFAAEEAGASRVVALDEYVWALDWPAYWRHVDERRRAGLPAAEANDVPEAWRPDTLPGKAGFDTARRLRGSKVEEVVLDIGADDLTPAGQFDVVLFVGVLYHLADPIGALRRVYSVTGDMAVVGTHVIRMGGLEDRALTEFFPHDELNDDPTNWWIPNMKALTSWCSAVGFRKVEVAFDPDTVVPPPGPGESDRQVGIVHAYR